MKRKLRFGIIGVVLLVIGSCFFSANYSKDVKVLEKANHEELVAGACQLSDLKANINYKNYLTFSPSTYYYGLNVAAGINSVSIYAKAPSGYTVTINGTSKGTGGNQTVSLPSSGSKNIPINVKSNKGSCSSSTYYVNINRASNIKIDTWGSTTLKAGGSTVISFTNPNAEKVTVTSSNTAVLKVDSTVTSFSYISAVNPGTATITVKTGFQTFTKTYKVTGNALKSLSISGPTGMANNMTSTYRLNFNPSDAYVQTSSIRWAVNQGSGAARITPNGKTATLTGTKSGTVRICATVGNINTCNDVNIWANNITSLSNSCGSGVNLKVGESYDLTNCANYSPMSASVKFTCSNSSGATSLSGCRVTGRSDGTNIILVKDSNSGRSINVIVNVKSNTGGNTGGTKETLTCPTTELYIDETKTLNGKSSIGSSISYSTSSPYLTISGNQVSGRGNISQTQMVYITMKSSAGTNRNCAIKVKALDPTTIHPGDDDDDDNSGGGSTGGGSTGGGNTIEYYTLRLKNSTTLIVGGSEKLTAVESPLGFSGGLKWESTNPGVVTVDSNGNLKAVGEGTGNIKVYSVSRPEVFAICYVTVVQNRVEVTDLKIVPTTLTLKEGEKKNLQYEISPKNATDQNVYFRSANNSVATVTSDGLVTAVGFGSTTITVYTKDGRKTSKATVYVQKNNPSGGGSTGGGSTGGGSTGGGSTGGGSTGGGSTGGGSTGGGSTGGGNNQYLSYDNTLISLTVHGKNIYLGSYMPTIYVDNNVTKVSVEYKKSDNKARVSVTGNDNLQVGNNVITISVTSEVNEENKYRVVVVRKGENNQVGSDIITEQPLNKEVKIITTDAPVVAMRTLEEIKDNQQLLIVDVQDTSGKSLYTWHLDGAYLTYNENGLNTVINYQKDVPDNLSTLINNDDASYVNMKQTGPLASAAIINMYVGDKYQDNTMLYLYRANEDSTSSELLYGGIKVVDGYVQLRMYEGDDYFLTASLVIPKTDYTVVYLGVIMFILLIGGSVYLVVRRKKHFR